MSHFWKRLAHSFNMVWQTWRCHSSGQTTGQSQTFNKPSDKLTHRPQTNFEVLNSPLAHTKTCSTTPSQWRHSKAHNNYSWQLNEHIKRINEFDFFGQAITSSFFVNNSHGISDHFPIISVLCSWPENIKLKNVEKHNFKKFENCKE